MKADEANAALSTPNVTDIFKIVKHICSAIGVRTGDGGTPHPRSTRQYGLTFRLPLQPEFGDPPTWEEFQRVIRDMRLSKAGGEDTMTAEYLKLAGPRMEQQVFATVLSCWQQASQAEAGYAGHDWPQAWKKGILIPLWKKNRRQEKS